MDKSKLFHCLMVDGMYESFVIESLQNGMIMSSPFLSWYTVVLWMVMSAVFSNNVLCVSILSFDFRIVPTLWYFCDFSFFYDFCNLYKNFKIIAYISKSYKYLF
jgi:hypothetical protein